jgi:CheY-like chemotaxis protein
MDEATRSRIFEPFFTTKESGKGTGLGLSQVHGFVHQSGGTVTIKSDVGRGTRITLYLPRASAESPAAAPSDAQRASVVGRRVLLVEDNPEVASVTNEMLARMGCAAETVGNADAALQALDQREFDVVLSDIVMAGSKNGLDLARTIRDIRPHLPVILATGYSEAAAQAAGEFTVLRKPYQSEDLSWAFAILDERERQSSPQPNVVDFPERKNARLSKPERPT